MRLKNGEEKRNLEVKKIRSKANEKKKWAAKGRR